MAKKSIVAALLFLCAAAGKAQHRLFFESVDVSLNAYFAETAFERALWNRIVEPPLHYNLDTFSQIVPIGKKGGLPQAQRTTIGMRLSGRLYREAASHFKKHLEWRAGLQVARGFEADAWFTDRKYDGRFPPYTFREVRLEYRRLFTDLNPQVVYNTALNTRRAVTFYAGAGVGAVGLFNGKIGEEVVVYEATPSGGNGTYISETDRQTSTLPGRTLIQPYAHATAGLQWRWAPRLYFLPEVMYQSYLSSAGNGVYRQAVVASLIFRYRFR